MRIFDFPSNEANAAMLDVERRRNESEDAALDVARIAIAGVRERGDEFVSEEIARFDRVVLAPDSIRITPGRGDSIEPAMKRAIDLAIERIDDFHRQQLPSSYRWQRDGAEVVHRVRPLRRVGIYVPGGGAVYLSTLIMCAVPARIAGVRELVVATTPAATERNELHYACTRLGVEAIYRCGGAAGIAALALGTGTLARVDKIVGPGNRYVTAAKQLVGRTHVGIDMTAGPTELVVIADDSSDAALVASDLLAQAEHGDDSALLCITTSAQFAQRLAAEVPRQLERAQPSSAAHRSLPSNGMIVIVSSREDAVALADRIAPEHLAIHTADAAWYAERAENCGAIFVGPWSPVAGGDYIVGPNHVLPTAGTARFASPLGVYDFVKRSNVIALSADAIATLASSAEALAEFEGLPLHARSIAMRRENATAGAKENA